MRWWLQTTSKLFSVDNSAVKGMDYSSLTPDIWMVQWIDGRGEIERQTPAKTNLNGLREAFIDIIPYCPFFQQFMWLLGSSLTLPQAKKVQIELIGEVFSSKRQAPYHYPVAAGDYWWDATDETLYSSTAAGLQSAIASLNTVIDKLNSVVASVNAIDATIVQGVNTQMSTINSGISAIGNVLIGQVNQMIAEMNSDIVDNANSAFGSINGLFGVGNSLVAYINNTLLSTSSGGGPANSVNVGLYAAPGQGTPPPGIPSDVPHTGIVWGSNPNTTLYISTITPGTFNNVSSIASGGPIPWTNLPHVAVANVNWIPIGSTVPVNVTPAEQAAIMSGIAARTADLNVKKNTKVGEVNAMTTISDAIIYDVTTGW